MSFFGPFDTDRYDRLLRDARDKIRELQKNRLELERVLKLAARALSGVGNKDSALTQLDAALRESERHRTK